LPFKVISDTLWLRRCLNTQKSLKKNQPFGVVLKCYLLLLAVFRDFDNFLPILVDFLLSKGSITRPLKTIRQLSVALTFALTFADPLRNDIRQRN
jgi:hypothetical protein